MILRGRPSRRPIEVADTASVGATIAPSVSAAAGVNSGTVRYATYPTANAVATVSPTAISAIGRRFFRSATYELSSPADHTNGGRITDSTKSGDSSTEGTPGIRPMAKPATTSTSADER